MSYSAAVKYTTARPAVRAALRSRSRKLRHVGILTSQTLSTAELESRQYTESLERLQEEERKSMARIQNELYDVKQKLKTSLTDQTQSQSVLSVNASVRELNELSDPSFSGEEDNILLTGESVETSAMFLPGMMYHNNGSIRTPTRKFKSLGYAHNQLLRQLKQSQSTFHKVIPSALKNHDCVIAIIWKNHNCVIAVITITLLMTLF